MGAVIQRTIYGAKFGKMEQLVEYGREWLNRFAVGEAGFDPNRISITTGLFGVPSGTVAVDMQFDSFEDLASFRTRTQSEAETTFWTEFVASGIVVAGSQRQEVLNLVIGDPITGESGIMLRQQGVNPFGTGVAFDKAFVEVRSEMRAEGPTAGKPARVLRPALGGSPSCAISEIEFANMAEFDALINEKPGPVRQAWLKQIAENGWLLDGSLVTTLYRKLPLKK